jgi:hypothetical protein
MMPLHHTRIEDFVPEERQEVLEAGFAMHYPPIHMLDPLPFRAFFHLPIGQT